MTETIVRRAPIKEARYSQDYSIWLGNDWVEAKREEKLYRLKNEKFQEMKIAGQWDKIRKFVDEIVENIPHLREGDVTTY